ncbi:MAG: FISUMP domain-containing protein, partial [Flavobacteriales bacterium]
TATTSIFANSADSANFASNAGVALSANTADFASSAVTAESATTAEFASNAETANSANFSDFATNASFAQTAIFSNSADFASNAEGANTANFAAFADSSNYSTNSGIAAQSITSEFSDSSAIANHSNNATFAVNAENAENAENANFAITSATAFSANNANSANSANSANVALNGIAGVSAIGDSLFLTNGNFFIIPGISEANSSEVFGCSDPAACNYNPSVTQSDNSCYYPGFSCNDGNLNSSNDTWNSECQCQGTTGLVGSQHSCGAENVHSQSITYGSMVDQSGNIYKTVDINGQVWMAENLKTESYSNGDAIAFNLTNSQWQSITTGAWAHYDNNPAAACPYGKLYNWYAISDPRGLCPIGWHVP